MFENVDGRTTDAGVTGILIAHLGTFGSGELKRREEIKWRRENGEMRERHRKTDKHPRNGEINMEEGRETLKF